MIDRETSKVTVHDSEIIKRVRKHTEENSSKKLEKDKENLNKILCLKNTKVETLSENI
jgi:hypothetical protein